MTQTLDVRGLQAAPPYLEDEGTEIAWLRADLATTADDARVVMGLFGGMEAEDVKDLDVTGPKGMRPDERDEFHERWMLCEDAQAFGRYWQIEFA